jgi:hypothetical protein
MGRPGSGQEPSASRAASCKFELRFVLATNQTVSKAVFRHNGVGELPVLDEGVWAEIKVEGHHLRLFSEHSALGVHASVYDVANKRWIAPSEAVDDIEEGKEKAIAYARNYLRPTGIEFPVLNWKKARAV